MKDYLLVRFKHFSTQNFVNSEHFYKYTVDWNLESNNELFDVLIGIFNVYIIIN